MAEKPNPDIQKDAQPSHVAVLKPVRINDGEEVRVSEEAEKNFYQAIPDNAFVDDSAFKCTGCGLLTVHNGVEVQMRNPTDMSKDIKKRLYGCTNCGRMGLK